MGGEPHEDVTSTLSELERRLIELERELVSVASARRPDPSTPVTPPRPAAPAKPSLRAELDELVVLRDRLRTIADELVERCDRLVGRLERTDAGAAELPRSGAADD